MTAARVAIAVLVPLSLGACAVVPPSGPSVMALPGNNKSLDAFNADDLNCRNYAQQQTGIAPQQAANNAAVGSAAIGTALGAAAGALIGSASGNTGAGLAIGAGTGLVAGSAVGAGNANATGYSLQQRYDTAYSQCIVSTGNTIQQPPPAYAAFPYPPGYGYPYPYGYYSYGPRVYMGFGGYYGRRYW